MLTIRISDIGNKLGALAGLPPSRWQTAGNGRPPLSEVIARIRRRWRLRRLLQGLFWVLLLTSTLLLASAWLLHHWHFSIPAVWTLRAVLIAALLVLLWRYALQPLRRELSDSSVALYLEENEPSLCSIMLSAVDAEQATTQNLSPRLVERLQNDALQACARVDYGDKVERQGLRAALTRLGITLLAIISLSPLLPEFIGLGARALLTPWTQASAHSPYSIELQPGNIEIARGADQLLSARIAGYDGDDVLLFTSTDDGASWQQLSMAAGSAAGVYEYFMFDLNQPLDYFVTAVGQQSPTYRIKLADIPAIADIALRYHFPAYTMLAPETTTGGGDITALRGTRVEVLVTPTIGIPGGALVLDDGRRIELQPGAGAYWAGEITVEDNAAYRVTLQRASGVPVDASPEFRITALDDQHPSISIVSPGRDTKVSMVEEPLIRIRAQDDQGIADLELVLSVNGEDEQAIPLLRGQQGQDLEQQVDAEHTIFLEDLNLQPGDLVSYYVKAEERAPEAQARTATSDIFFYQVRPFSTNYRNAEQQGGGGGGGGQGGQRQGHLSEQQKQFVIATFKLMRDRDQYDAETLRENLKLLVTTEARIRARVEAIIRRLGNRAMLRADDRYQIVMDELPQASEAMLEVEEKLTASEIEAALADAQIALKHLQRADAAFRDINVSLANRGGGAGNTSGFEDLANLFRLEMDKLRNQYETVQRGQQQPPQEQAIDEALERLRDLARRQQQEVERQIRRQDQATGGGSDDRQLALAEELEEMARQLERLTREQPNSQLQQSVSQMRSAAEAMRRATAGGSGGGDISQARQAAERLREAERLLDQGRLQKFSEEVERTLRQAELVEKKQARIKREVSALDENWSTRLESQLQQVEQRKRVLADDLARLESELSKLTTAARDEQPRAGQSLKRAIRASREHRLHDRIGRTRTMIQLGEKQHAIDNENEILKGIGQLRENIESALTSIDEPDSRGLARSLQQMRALSRELSFLRERMRGSANGRGGSADGESPNFGPQLDDIAQRSGELGRELLEHGVASGDIGPVLEKMVELSRVQDVNGLSLSSEQALEALMDLEFRLRQQLDDPPPEMLVSRSAELPQDYAALIAEYFRKLSDSRAGTPGSASRSD